MANFFKNLRRPSIDASKLFPADSKIVANQVNQQEKEALNKSMKSGKAHYTDYASSLDLGTSDATSASKGTVLEHKRILKRFAENAIVQSIIRTRTSQVIRYGRPARFSSEGVGYKILPKNPSKSGKLSPQQLNRIQDLEDFIQNTGAEWTPQRGGGFAQFLSEFVYNHYVFDQINVEKIRDKDGHLNHFNFVDGGTVVLKDLPKSVDQPRHFLQMTGEQEKPVEFTEDELTFSIYNAHADVARHGYGYSEVEAALNQLQYQFDTEQFNARFFSQGGTTRGILLIDTGATAAQNTAALNSIRREWQASFSGTNGAWKIPVVSAHDAKFVNMTQSSKDMEFENWLTYLINIISSIFQIQPDEINFPNRGGATGKSGGNSVNEGSTQKAKMQQSKDKGLQPLLQYIEDFINAYILPEVDQKYYFHFTIGEAKDALQQEQIRNQQLNNGMTLNEARKGMGLEPLPGDMGNYPGNAATVVQFMQLQASQDEIFQNLQQHKNDNDPKAADHGKPQDGMPASAVDGKTKSGKQEQVVDNDNKDNPVNNAPSNTTNSEE